MAGPVKDDRVTLTNRNWIIAGREMEQWFGIQRVRLINDFVANGYGLLTIKSDETVTLQEGTVDPAAPIACIGAGTGLLFELDSVSWGGGG